MPTVVIKYQRWYTLLYMRRYCTRTVSEHASRPSQSSKAEARENTQPAVWRRSKRQQNKLHTSPNQETCTKRELFFSHYGFMTWRNNETPQQFNSRSKAVDRRNATGRGEKRGLRVLCLSFPMIYWSAAFCHSHVHQTTFLGCTAGVRLHDPNTTLHVAGWMTIKEVSVVK